MGEFYKNLNLQIWIQLDNNSGHFTCSPKGAYIVDNIAKFLYIDNRGEEPSVACPWQQ